MATHIMTPNAAPACAAWRDGDSWAPNGHLELVDCESCHLAILKASQPLPAPVLVRQRPAFSLYLSLAWKFIVRLFRRRGAST